MFTNTISNSIHSLILSVVVSSASLLKESCHFSINHFSAQLGTKTQNPTHGWWFVQILSTKRLSLSSLSNPTNGSWWFVQILSIHGSSLSSGALRAER